MAKRGKGAEELGEVGEGRVVVTGEVVDRMCQALRAGAYLETAAVYAGLTLEGMRNFLRRCEKSRDRVLSRKYRRWRAQMSEAMAQGEMKNISVVATAAHGVEVVKTRVTSVLRADGSREQRTETTTSVERDWKAAAWLLERRNPDRWARRLEVQTTKVSGQVRRIELPENNRHEDLELEGIEDARFEEVRVGRGGGVASGGSGGSGGGAEVTRAGE